MGTNNLTDKTGGQVIEQAFFNDIHSALKEDFVGRNSSGVPESGKNLGTAVFPWGTIRGSSLVIGGVTLDTSQLASQTFSVFSGKTRSTSNQPAFLTPAGTGNGASVTVAGATTNLSFDVGGVTYALASDIVKSGLSLAPSSNNTCLVNDADAADGGGTRVWGEPKNSKKVINIDTAGTELTSLNGSYQAFKHGSEIFIGYLDTTAGTISNCYRGFFYDENLAPINRDVFSDDDTITLLKAAYLFLDSDLVTVDVTYNRPIWDDTQPGSPATGDYWFDFATTQWKRYNGTIWEVVNRTFIGIAVTDSADCIGARCVDFTKTFKDDLNLELEIESNFEVRANQPHSAINVYGTRIEFGFYNPKWSMTSNLAAAADMYASTEQPSRDYFFYVKDDRGLVISDIEPFYRPELQGFYHPHNPWRCVASAFNDSSSHLVSIEQIDGKKRDQYIKARGLIMNSDEVLIFAGEAIEPLDAVCIDYDSAAGIYRIYLADDDNGRGASFVGFALKGARVGDPVSILQSGFLSGFSGLSTGIDQYISTTPGALAATGNFFAGTALSSTSILVNAFTDGMNLPAALLFIVSQGSTAANTNPRTGQISSVEEYNFTSWGSGTASPNARSRMNGGSASAFGYHHTIDGMQSGNTNSSSNQYSYRYNKSSWGSFSLNGKGRMAAGTVEYSGNLVFGFGKQSGGNTSSLLEWNNSSWGSTFSGSDYMSYAGAYVEGGSAHFHGQAGGVRHSTWNGSTVGTATYPANIYNSATGCNGGNGVVFGSDDNLRTEEWNGSSWGSVINMIAKTHKSGADNQSAAAGTDGTSAFVAGGSSDATNELNNLQIYSGTSWSSGATLTTARTEPTGSIF